MTQELNFRRWEGDNFFDIEAFVGDKIIEAENPDDMFIPVAEDKYELLTLGNYVVKNPDGSFSVISEQNFRLKYQ